MEEEKLIKLAKRGDTSAFEQLLDRYQKRVYHQALRMLGNPEDAADVTQEVFLKVWKGLPNFREESGFATWLYRLTDHAAIDLLRAEKKRQGDSSLDDGVTDLLTADPSPGPQQSAEQKELQQAVAAALSALPEEQRRILILREINGLSYEEIGDVLNLPPGTVRSRLARSRAALAKRLRTSGNFF